MGENSKRTTLRLPLRVWTQLEGIIQKTGYTQTQVFIHAIEDYARKIDAETDSK